MKTLLKRQEKALNKIKDIEFRRKFNFQREKRTEQLLIDMIINGKCYYMTSSGSGRYTTYKSYRSNVTYLLEKWGVMYSDENDAPRGGVHGDYIKINIQDMCCRINKN